MKSHSCEGKYNIGVPQIISVNVDNRKNRKAYHFFSPAYNLLFYMQSHYFNYGVDFIAVSHIY